MLFSTFITGTFVKIFSERVMKFGSATRLMSSIISRTSFIRKAIGLLLLMAKNCCSFLETFSILYLSVEMILGIHLNIPDQYSSKISSCFDSDSSFLSAFASGVVSSGSSSGSESSSDFASGTTLSSNSGSGSSSDFASGTTSSSDSGSGSSSDFVSGTTSSSDSGSGSSSDFISGTTSSSDSG